jgi:ABC-type Fe3+ transport system permease subunit
MKRTRLTPTHFVPLAGFIVPTVVIGYGFVIPRSCIAGWNQLTVGFAATVLGACLTYVAGLRLVIRDQEKRDGEV